MKDGYYLAAYIEINKLCNVYEVSQRHDQNISLWKKDGENIQLIHYWELERLTGIKKHSLAFYDVEQAISLINQLLSIYDLTIENMNDIWGTPELQKNNEYYLRKGEVSKHAYHSICHLFSAIMMDTQKFFNGNIIGMSVDLGSDNIIEADAKSKYEYSGCVVRQGQIEYFSISSPALLWILAKSYFNMQEGSLMALASASTSNLYVDDDIVIEIKDSNSTEAIEYFNNICKKVEKLTEDDAGILFNGFDSRFSLEDNKASMVMKEIQKMSMKIMDQNITKVLQNYDLNLSETYFAVAGGFALNCPTNSYLMNKFKFKDFIAPPCVSDCGQSLGIALYTFYKKLNKFNFKLENPYYGNCKKMIYEILKKGKYNKFIKSVSEFNLKDIVEDIKYSPIIWINGRSEIGPRALGNRSILADPRYIKSKDKINEIKKRQWWRPVAPIVLEEDVNEWFIDAYASPFMLNTFKVKEDQLNKVPAILHLDNSARIQTINREEGNLTIYKIIKAFKDDTGVPIICNTSLNDKGEPIINTEEEAINFALRKGIKVGYFNGFRVEFFNHNLYLMEKPLERPIKIQISKKEKINYIKETNPHNIPINGLIFYMVYKSKYTFDLKKKDDARMLTLLGKKLLTI